MFLLFALFVYKLDYTALFSYDEAWYGEIARNLVSTQNPFALLYNGTVFSDHPPFGFMLMAVPIALLGSTEFSVRLTSVILGVGCVALMYLLGKKMGGRVVGVSAAAILLSCMWFVFRTRSGNLDVPFLFWQILTVYLLLSENRKSIFWAALSFAALILTKTLVGLGLIPVILFILWQKRRKIEKKQIFLALILISLCVLPWYVFNHLRDDNFLRHHFFEIGTRGNDNSYGLDSITTNLRYLAIGIGKWFKVFLVASLFGAIVFLREKKQRFYLLLLFFWFVGFSVFLFSRRTEIWHLIPLYPVIALFIPFATLACAHTLRPQYPWIKTFMGAGFVALATYQFIQFSSLLYAKERMFSSERDIALKASAYENLHLMETFYPATVYYSQKRINPLHWHPDSYQEMTKMLKTQSEGVFIINADLKQRLEEDKTEFHILDQNSSYYVITNKKE